MIDPVTSFNKCIQAKPIRFKVHFDLISRSTDYGAWDPAVVEKVCRLPIMNQNSYVGNDGCTDLTIVGELGKMMNISCYFRVCSQDSKSYF